MMTSTKEKSTPHTPYKKENENAMQMQCNNKGSEKVIAAYNFLRRGYTGSLLRNEANRFYNHLKQNLEKGNAIAHPLNYLQKVWQINADNNTSPADGALIADLLEAAQCTDLDTICRVERLNLAGDTLQVWLTTGTPDEVAQRLYEQMRQADMSPILERWHARRIECTVERAEIIADNLTRTHTYTMPLAIAEVWDNMPPAPNDEDTESAQQTAYLQEHHPQELQRIIDYVCKYKGWRNVQLYEQWKEAEQHSLQPAKWTDGQIIGDKCAEIASREADALQRDKVRQFYEYYTQTL